MRYAGTVAELAAAGGRRVVQLGAREVLLIHADGAIRAVDRSCPHEGYGLEDGTLEGGTLTCPWHGWRFDLASGACLVAGTDVRAYRVEVQDGAVFVDADVASTAEERALASEALLGALERGDTAAAARRTVRLAAFGATARELVALLARYGGSHAEGELDPETAALGDALALAEALPTAAVPLLADAASALAERLARALPRFGADRASPFAWGDLGVRETLAGLVADGDAEETEAVVAGMVAAGVAPTEIGAGVACGLAVGFRGAWPLIVLRRAVELADALGPDVARALLPIAARGAAGAPTAGARPAFRAAADGVAAAGAVPTPDALRGAAGAALATFDMAAEEEAGAQSLLGCALALAHADAAAWAVELAGEAARGTLLHAAALVAMHAAPGEFALPPVQPLEMLLARGAAQTGRGLAVCLAAAAVAVRCDDAHVRVGVARLLATPRRERFTLRHALGADVEV